jgi:hypothetical protein
MPVPVAFRKETLSMQRFVLAALMLVCAPAPAQDPCHQKTTPECLAIQQQRCRQAVDMGLEMGRQLPTNTSREVQDKKALMDKIQAMIAENRRNGVDECTTWGQLNRIAVNQ